MGCRPRVEIADFVEEQRALVGGFKAAAAAHQCAGEGAFFVAEEFVFDQRFGKVRAGESDERASVAAAHLMDGARHQFLAGAGFAGDQDVYVARRDFLRQREKFLHRGGRAEQFVKPAGAARIGAELVEFFLRNMEFYGAPQNQAQLDHVRGIGDAVIRAVFHHVDEQ